MFVMSKPVWARAAQRCVNSALFLFSLFLLTVTSALAGQALLAWDASQSTGAVGYMLYYGQASGSYTSKIDAGNQTTYTVPNLLDGTKYYYAVTAYDASRTESGFSNEASATVPSAPPVASFSANLTSGAVPLSVVFTSTSSGSITGYSWNFGDGTAGTAQNPSHAYGTAGVYSVSLTVTGPGGSNTSTKSSYITVSQPAATTPPPVAAFTVDKTSGLAPLAVNFSSTSTGSISSYSWNFGDGGTSTATNPVHSYSAAGTYAVGLTVTGAGGSNTASKSGYIVVSPAPPPPIGTLTPPTGTLTAGFTADLTSGVAPLKVQFTSTSTGSISRYRWSFGDGTGSSTMNPAHTYNSSGTYKVALTVFDASGHSNKLVKSGYVAVAASPPPPSPAPVSIAFVQQSYATPQTAQSVVPVHLASAQIAGNLSVVVVGWNDTVTTVASVTDSKGNVYARAVGPTVGNGISQSIYYAKNIIGGDNTVTVNFNAPAQYADIRVLEYSGLDKVNPVDVVAGATGNGLALDSGAATTINANDLIVGASTIAHGTAALGAGFTARVITSPDSDLVEDRIVSSAGAYRATCSQDTVGGWVMQMLALKKAP